MIHSRYDQVERMIREGGRLAAGDVVDLRTGRRFNALICFRLTGEGEGAEELVEVQVFGEALDPEALDACTPIFADGSPVPSMLADPE